MNKSTLSTATWRKLWILCRKYSRKCNKSRKLKQRVARDGQIKTKLILKLKQLQKATKINNTTNNNKITCECGCKINKSSWYTHIKQRNIKIIETGTKTRRKPKTKRRNKRKSL
jgi:hypothetical protein